MSGDALKDASQSPLEITRIVGYPAVPVLLALYLVLGIFCLPGAIAAMQWILPLLSGSNAPHFDSAPALVKWTLIPASGASAVVLAAILVFIHDIHQKKNIGEAEGREARAENSDPRQSKSTASVSLSAAAPEGETRVAARRRRFLLMVRYRALVVPICLLLLAYHAWFLARAVVMFFQI